MKSQRIVIAAAQVPLTYGGAEWHVEALRAQLIARGHQVEVVAIPFQWSPREAVLRSALAWRALDLTESNGVPIDRIIATRFPSYAVRHPNKVLWLFHPFRQAYDLHEAGVDGFPATPDGEDLRRRVIEMDVRMLRECRRIYTTSRNNAERLARFTGTEAEILRLPLLAPERWNCAGWQDFVLSAGRLDQLKRTELLIRAVPYLPAPARVVVVGQGPQRANLERLAQELGVGTRVDFKGFVSDEELRSLFGLCSAVFYAPFDEDYGLVTLEAFHSRKPVVTSVDAGGPLEFVEHEQTGFVVPPEPADIGRALAALLADRDRARAMGARGYERVRGIDWDEVICALTAD